MQSLGHLTCVARGADGVVKAGVGRSSHLAKLRDEKMGK